MRDIGPQPLRLASYAGAREKCRYKLHTARIHPRYATQRGDGPGEKPPRPSKKGVRRYVARFALLQRSVKRPKPDSAAKYQFSDAATAQSVSLSLLPTVKDDCPFNHRR